MRERCSPAAFRPYRAFFRPYLLIVFFLGGALLIYNDVKILTGPTNHQGSTTSIVETKRRITSPTAAVSAYFGGQPVYHVTHRPPHSRVHCVSENFQENAWMYRSCRFDYLCFDLQTKEFVLHPSLHHQQLEGRSSRDKNTFLSTEAADMIAGGAHAFWLKNGRGRWKPIIRNTTNVSSYYMLSNDTVWISYYALGDCNTGHQLWDSMMPIYTLLEIFDWTSTDIKLFLTTIPSPNGFCSSFINEFISFMGAAGPIQITSDLELRHVNQDNAISANNTNTTTTTTTTTLVCAKHSASGMGWLTDHGLQQHDSQLKHALDPINVRRGPNFRGFRNFMLRNVLNMSRSSGESSISISISSSTMIRQPLQITFSILSSRQTERRFDFATQALAVQEFFGDRVLVQRIAMWNYTLREQVDVVLKSSIFISTSGGGTAPAFFLRPGASLIIYDNDLELDWDLWNNYADLRVHWVGEHVNNTQYLVDLVRDEIDTIEESLAR